MVRVATRGGKRKARHLRVRRRLKGVPERPRLSVFRSHRYIYVQVIDDSTGNTLAAASSRILEEANGSKGLSKTGAAQLVGAEIARRAKAASVASVVFDRGGYKYHGRVKALAEAAREGGLKF